MAFTENQNIVAEYYIAALGRVPDKSGLDHWVGRLEGTIENESKLTEDEIRDQFFNRDIAEVTLRFPENQNVEEFVVSIYKNVFGREADSGGLEYWKSRLTEGSNSDQSTLTQNELLSEMLRIAKATGNEIDNAYLQEKLQNAELEYTKGDDTQSPSITSIQIADGNYTPNSIVDVTVTFDENIVIENTDSQLTVNIGEYTKLATFAYSTSNTMVFKYIIEDGISSEEQTIKIPVDALVLNTTTIQDTSKNNATIVNTEATNENAIVNDNQAPSITINSAHYTSNTDKIILNGSGFLSIKEQNEDEVTDIMARFDFSKFIWDIDGLNDANTSLIGNTLFTSSDIRLINIINNNEISIVFTKEFTALEEATGFGHGNAGDAVDTIDILSGFVLDTVGNISSDKIVNDITVGIDNHFYGNNNDNILIGTSNDDFINAGAGVDILTGGAGADTFVFSSTSNEIDIIKDLSLNGSNSDKIDLDITIKNVNGSVTGSVNENNFINDINTLVSVTTNGFNTLVEDDISATIVHTNSNKSYMVIDRDGDNSFTKDDFAIEITGVTVDNFDETIFI